MFYLTDAEITALRDKDYSRRMSALRVQFIDLEGHGERSGRYFDENLSVAQRLEALVEADILLLLRIGYIQNLPVIVSSEFKECQTRCRWYGRRLWLKDRFEKLHKKIE